MVIILLSITLSLVFFQYTKVSARAEVERIETPSPTPTNSNTATGSDTVDSSKPWRSEVITYPAEYRNLKTEEAKKLWEETRYLDQDVQYYKAKILNSGKSVPESFDSEMLIQSVQSFNQYLVDLTRKGFDVASADEWWKSMNKIVSGYNTTIQSNAVGDNYNFSSELELVRMGNIPDFNKISQGDQAAINNANATIQKNISLAQQNKPQENISSTECKKGCRENKNNDNWFEGWIKNPLCDMGCGISLAFDSLLNWVSKLFTWMTEDTAEFFTNTFKLQTAWKIILSLVDYILVIILIVVAFANILRIQIDNYTLKKILPSLILGVVLANLSWLICMTIIEFADILTRFLVETAAKVIQVTGNASTIERTNMMSIIWEGVVKRSVGTLTAIFGGGGTGLAVLFGGIAAALSGGGFLAAVIFVILILVPFLLILIVNFLLIARTLTLAMLVVTAPLAFLAMGFPMTQKLFQQWWGQFSKWVFMLPLIYLLMTLAVIIASSIQSNTGTGIQNAAGISNIILWVAQYVLVIATMYYSLKIPFTIGGAVMSFWGGTVGKKIGGWAGRLGDRGFGKSRDWLASKPGLSGLSKIPTPIGLIKGYPANLKRKQDEYEQGEMGKGENLAEKVRGGMRRLGGGGGAESLVDEDLKSRMALIKSKGENMSLGGKSKDELKDIFDTYYKEIVPGSVKSNSSDVDIEDYDRMGSTLVAMANVGKATDEDMQKYVDLGMQSNDPKVHFQALATNRTVSSLSNTGMPEDGNPFLHYVGSKLTKNTKGDIVRTSAYQQFSEASNDIEGRIHTGGRDKNKQNLQSAINSTLIAEDGSIKAYSDLEGKEKALADFVVKLEGNEIAKGLNLNGKGFGEIVNAYKNPDEIPRVYTQALGATQVISAKDNDFKLMIQELERVNKGIKNLSPEKRAKLKDDHDKSFNELMIRINSGKYDLNTPDFKDRDFAHKFLPIYHNKDAIQTHNELSMRAMYGKLQVADPDININADPIISSDNHIQMGDTHFAALKTKVDDKAQQLGADKVAELKRHIDEMINLSKRHNDFREMITEGGKMQSNIEKGLAGAAGTVDQKGFKQVLESKAKKIEAF